MRSNVFIITRFNLKLWNKDKNNNQTQSAEWLDDRFELFEKYCYSSILSQVYKNFLWVVLFADDTPVKWKNRTAELQKDLPTLMPCYLNEEETANLKDYIEAFIREHHDDSSTLITVRLDNDDALSRNYIKDIVNSISSQEDMEKAYSFKYGIQYYRDKNLALRIPYPNNHFLYLINKSYSSEKPFNIIISFNHYFTQRLPFPFECLMNKEPMWAEVIHGRNVDNDMKVTLNQHLVLNEYCLQHIFGWNVRLSKAHTFWALPTFVIPRFISQFHRRLKGKLFRK